MKKELKRNLINILRSYGAVEIILFGSYARGDNRPDSDVDVIVEFNETKGLIKKAEIIRVIFEKLGVQIHLLSKDYINPMLKPYIEKDMKVLYKKDVWNTVKNDLPVLKLNVEKFLNEN